MRKCDGRTRREEAKSHALIVLTLGDADSILQVRERDMVARLMAAALPSALLLQHRAGTRSSTHCFETCLECLLSDHRRQALLPAFVQPSILPN